MANPGDIQYTDNPTPPGPGWSRQGGGGSDAGYTWTYQGPPADSSSSTPTPASTMAPQPGGGGAAKPWIGGTPAGATGTVGNFGLNQIPGPAQGSAGALGQVAYRPQNPWANHMLPNSGAVNPNDPSANLFRTMNPNSITPQGPQVQQPGAVPAGLGGLMGGMMGGGPPIMPTDPSGIKPQGPQMQPGGSPGGPPMMPAAPPGGGGGPGGGMSPQMLQMLMQRLGIGGGGQPQPSFAYNKPSPLLAASNPASGAPQAMTTGTGGGQPWGSTTLPPPRTGSGNFPLNGGGVGGPGMSSALPIRSPFNSAVFAHGGSVTGYADGGAADAPPDIPVTSHGSLAQRMDAIMQAIARGNQPGPAATASAGQDPLTKMIMQGNNPVGGYPGAAGMDNSAAGIMQRLGVRGPGVVRVGGGAPAGYAAGGPLAMAGYAAGRHVSGPSGGQDDSVNARLSDGEYVIDADVVSALGDGNNAAGAKRLDDMRANIRGQKRAAPASKIPPKAKPPAAYLPKGKQTAASAAARAAIASGRR